MRLKMTDEQKGMLASTIAYIIFGFSYLFSKMALGVTEPMILLTLRFTVTFIGLNLLLLTGVFKVNFKGKNLGGAIRLLDRVRDEENHVGVGQGARDELHHRLLQLV